MKYKFIKLGDGVTDGLMPADPPTIAAFRHVKNGSIFEAEFKKKNHTKFHQKLIMLFCYAFEYWQPGEIDNKYGKPEKNFDRFRKDVTIMAGFYTVVINLKGEARAEAKSISFANMDNDEREQVYQKVLTVIMERIFPQFKSVEVEETAQKYWNDLLGFA